MHIIFSNLLCRNNVMKSKETYFSKLNLNLSEEDYLKKFYPICLIQLSPRTFDKVLLQP